MSDVKTDEVEDGWEAAEVIIKAGASFMTGFGVSALVRGATENIPTSTWMPMKACVIVAKLGIASAITVAVDKNNDTKISNMISKLRSTHDKVKAAKEEG